MTSKRKTSLGICVTLFLFSSLPLLRAATTSDPLHSCIALVDSFKKSMEILGHLQRIDEKDQEALSVLCKGCQKYKLSCGELTGNLCADSEAESLNKLNVLLQEKNIQKIKALILSLSNEQQISCVFCKKFIAWG